MRPRSVPPALQRCWRVAVFISVALWGSGLGLFREMLPEGWADVWAAGTAPLLALWLFLMYRALPLNHPPGREEVAPSLSPATWVTWARGMAILAALGFVGLPPLPDGRAWIPALLFLVGVALDFADGLVARVTGRVTVMGRKLDVALDGLAVLGGVALAWRYGKVPAWYLLVGLARYLYLAVEHARRARGLPVYPLPSSMLRRALAGVQMGFLAAVLWPVFGPPGTHWAAYAFGLPFLAHFLWDGLVMVGWVRPGRRTSRVGASMNLWKRGISWVLRWGLAAWVMVRLFPWFETWTRSLPPPAGTTGRALVLLLTGTSAVGLLAGWMARTWAVVALGLLGMALHTGMAWHTETLVALWGLTAVFYIGGGMWEPEERLWRRFWGGGSAPSSSS